tara:strand:- start:2101 stop:2247 length:147 start_codon:yes stop_codon:yes gene_type:complete
MKKIDNIKLLFFCTVFILSLWSCSEASGQGTITMVISGSVHGQLDPCG